MVQDIKSELNVEDDRLMAGYKKALENGAIWTFNAPTIIKYIAENEMKSNSHIKNCIAKTGLKCILSSFTNLSDNAKEIFQTYPGLLSDEVVNPFLIEITRDLSSPTSHKAALGLLYFLLIKGFGVDLATSFIRENIHDASQASTIGLFLTAIARRAKGLEDWDTLFELFSKALEINSEKIINSTTKPIYVLLAKKSNHLLLEKSEWINLIFSVTQKVISGSDSLEMSIDILELMAENPSNLDTIYQQLMMFDFQSLYRSSLEKSIPLITLLADKNTNFRSLAERVMDEQQTYAYDVDESIYESLQEKLKGGQ